MGAKICKYPQSCLLKKTKKVRKIGEEELRLVRLMIDTMFKNHGVGLSANQIGANKRVFVASAKMKPEEVLVMINPKIVKKIGTVMDEEGCLSVPGFSAFVRRYEEVIVKGLSLEGKPVKVHAKGLLARIVQHEIDHLNGKIFIHRLPLLKRRKYLRRLNS